MIEINNVIGGGGSNGMSGMDHGSHDESAAGTGDMHSHVHARHAGDHGDGAMAASVSANPADKLVYHTWRFEKGNAQHITMYSSFILGAAIEIMMHHGVDLPAKLDIALGILAFAVEGFLFAFHLHAKAPVEIYLHVLLVYAIVGCVVFCALEAYDGQQVLFTYGRIMFTLFQGTWFYQVWMSKSWNWVFFQSFKKFVLTKKNRLALCSIRRRTIRDGTGT